MNIRSVMQLISHLLTVIGIAMTVCWGVAMRMGDPHEAVQALAVSSMITVCFGLVLYLLTRGPVDLSRRDGFAIVTLGWVIASVFGALPFYLSGTIVHPVSAVFETMSGFTTTGASVLASTEHLPRGILFWRALTHFFGGMGVLVLCVAILPFLGVGGMQLFRAEMPGPSKDRLTPRIAATAKLLWAVYVMLVVLETLLLRAGGMSWFDASCHSFATIATGGFSTRSQSIAAYNSLYIESVVILFMFLAGCSFALHYRLLQGKVGTHFKDPEFRAYLGVLIVVTGVVAVNTWKSVYADFGSALRAACFQVTSIMTTTGFATADFDRWPLLSRMLLLLLMFVGGCAGSTGGGIKVVRAMTVFKQMRRETRLFMQPQAVLPVKLGQTSLEPEVVSNIMAFVMLFMMTFITGSLVMSCFTNSPITAISSVAATLGNIGPGLGLVGPANTYAFIPPAGQGVLVFLMLLGRLELYTVLVMFLPGFWKR